MLTRQLKGSETHDTYYVYDDIGQLRFVLQPMYQQDASLDRYAFQYRYDARGRCIWKKLPGADYTTYTYDNADRLTFAQDGNQRTQSTPKWSYYLYDNLRKGIRHAERQKVGRQLYLPGSERPDRGSGF